MDITRNPLVALYNACDGNADEDGRLHVFGVPGSLVKTFNSDTVSVLASFAKLPRAEQSLLVGRTQSDAPEDALPSRNDHLIGSDPFGKAKAHLYNIIRQDRPYFEERIDIRDLFRVFVVEPQRSFERLPGAVRGISAFSVSTSAMSGLRSFDGTSILRFIHILY